jgi:hypothetical protein
MFSGLSVREAVQSLGGKSSTNNREPYFDISLATETNTVKMPSARSSVLPRPAVALAAILQQEGVMVEDEEGGE